jgi:hypothetical protein
MTNIYIKEGHDTFVDYCPGIVIPGNSIFILITHMSITNRYKGN